VGSGRRAVPNATLPARDRYAASLAWPGGWERRGAATFRWNARRLPVLDWPALLLNEMSEKVLCGAHTDPGRPLVFGPDPHTGGRRSVQSKAKRPIPVL